MAIPMPVPVTIPVLLPTVTAPPMGVLHIPPGRPSLNVIPEYRHIAVAPVIGRGDVCTYTAAVVVQPVGKV